MLLLSASLLAPAPALAECDTDHQDKQCEGSGLLAYVDDQGQLHVVDSLESIPQRYRGRARTANLGEVSSLSPSGNQQSRPRSQRKNSVTPTEPQPANTQRKTTNPPSSAAPKSSRSNQQLSELEQLKKQRDELVDQLALLDEGWVDPESKQELSEAALENRSRALSEQIDALDLRIKQLRPAGK